MGWPGRVLLLLGLTSSISGWASTCVISWLADRDLNSRIQNVIQKNPGEFKFYFGDLGARASYATLRSCLENDFEEVILIAHSKEDVPGKPSLLYPEGAGHFGFLNDHFFASVHLSPKLKLFTVAVCQAEILWRQYLELDHQLARAQVATRFAPPSKFDTWLLGRYVGRTLGGIVPLNNALKIVAESARAGPPGARSYDCYLYPDPVHPPSNSCAHGRLRLNVGGTRWAHAGWVRLTHTQEPEAWWLKRIGSKLELKRLGPAEYGRDGVRLMIQDEPQRSAQR